MSEALRDALDQLKMEIELAAAGDRECCAKCRFFFPGEYRDTGHIYCRRYPDKTPIYTTYWCGEFAAPKDGEE